MATQTASQQSYPLPFAVAEAGALPYLKWPGEESLCNLETTVFDGKLQRQDLLQFLVAIQQQYGWICPEAIDWCSRRLSETDSQISQEEIRGLIDFYSFLERSPCPGYHLYLSTNVTDEMLGQGDNIQFFQELQQTYPDQFKVSLTSCSGLCDQGPAGLLNGYPIAKLDSQIQNNLHMLLQGLLSAEDFLSKLPPVIDNIYQRQIILTRQLTPGEGLKAALAKSPQEFLGEVNQSRLRGRGGAGFPTGIKWQTCQQAAADHKVVICNADEGEPGTFKDRVLLHSHIEQVIEGMTIAAYAVGANQGYIYLRHEYQYLLPALKTAIETRYQNNLLGDNILHHAGFNFTLQIHLGAGAYICGEETALIESMEGKRGIPRIRPPFPAEKGYLGMPTIVNNVETFCCINEIALQGGDAFAQQECEGSTGTKVHSVSGDCANPGIYELPFDATIQDVLDLVNAENTQAVQVGGPSGKLLFPVNFSQTLNFSHVSSGGSFMIFNESRDLFHVVKNFTDFFHHESCGFCTPCRVGCGVLSKTLDRFQHQYASDDDIRHLEEMMELMDVASHCGLGQTAAHPVRYLLAAKPDFFAKRETQGSVLKIDVHELTAEATRLRQAENAGAQHDGD